MRPLIQGFYQQLTFKDLFSYSHVQTHPLRAGNRWSGSS